MACNIQRIRLQKQMKLQILNRPKTASRDQVDPLPRGGGPGTWPVKCCTPIPINRYAPSPSTTGGDLKAQGDGIHYGGYAHRAHTMQARHYCTFKNLGSWVVNYSGPPNIRELIMRELYTQ